jgi:uncharacterized phage protein (TIGR01671 family)
MREILFRGKRIDNGEWIEGYLVCDRVFWGEPDFHAYIVTHKHPSGCFGHDIYIEVDPSTVGQYTGLTDKNGKRIFEGDVLRIARTSDSMGNYWADALEYPVNVVVKWDFCAWVWETLCEDKRYIAFPDAWCHFECEIIGNIHDNPELLKEG